MEKNKKRTRRIGFYAIILFVLSLIIGCSTLFLGGPTSSSSMSSLGSSLTSSVTSEATSSLESSSSEVPSSSEASSSSEITSSSEVTSSSEASSSEVTSSSSSEVVAGPRLNLLEPEGQLTVLASYYHQAIDYFVTKDDTNVYVSGFNEEVLNFKTQIGTAASFNIQINNTSIATYSDAILISYFKGIGPETILVDSTGIVKTYAGMSLVGTAEDNDGTFYLVHNDNGSNNLYSLTEADTQESKVADLTSDLMYFNYSTSLFWDGLNAPSLPEGMFMLGAFNMSTFMQVYEFYSTNDMSLIFSVTSMEIPQVYLTNTSIFVASPFDLTVTQYFSDGNVTVYESYLSFYLTADQALVLKSIITNQALIFIDGELYETIEAVIDVVIFTDTEDFGSSVVLRYFDDSSVIYSLGGDYIGVQAGSSDFAEIQLSGSSLPQYIVYDSVSNNTLFTIYNRSLFYNVIDGHSYTIILPGEVTNFRIQQVTTIAGELYFTVYIPGAQPNPNDVEVYVTNNGNINQIHIVDENIISLQSIGIVENYLMLNASIATYTEIDTFVLNIVNEDYWLMDTDVWFLGPQIGSTDVPAFYIEGTTIHGYSVLGMATINLSEGEVSTNFDFSNDDFYGNVLIHENYFGTGDSLIFETYRAITATDEINQLSVYRGDLSLGFQSLTLIDQFDIAQYNLNNYLFLVTEDNFIELDPTNHVLNVLYFGLGDESYSYFVRNNEIILINTITYEETTAFLIADDFFSFYDF